MLRHTNQKRSGSGEGGGGDFRIQRHLPMQVVQWTKSPSAGRFTIQLIDQCVQSKSVPSFIGGPLVNHHHHPPPHHTTSRNPPLSQGDAEAHRRNKSPLPSLPAVGSPAARLASFQEFAVRLLRHLPPLPPPSLLLGCRGFKFVPWTCVCRRARLPYRPAGLARATRAPFRDGVCLPVLSGRLARRLSTVHVLWS